MAAHKLDINSFPRHAKPCGYCERLGDPDTRCEGCGAMVKRKVARRIVYYDPQRLEPWETIDAIVGKMPANTVMRDYRKLIGELPKQC